MREDQQTAPGSSHLGTSASDSPSRAVVALAGGVGGAKLASGLYRLLTGPRLGGGDLAVIVNTGDDFTHWGLHISPDLDTVLYNLAGIHHQLQGWGLQDESYRALAMVEHYGGDSWFRLGDADLATHIMRTHWLREGWTLAQVTSRLARGLGVTAQLLPMSDQLVQTMVHTDEGVLAFQEYFVRRRCEPRLVALEFKGLQQAEPVSAALSALARASAFVLCPSNPYLSLDPILLLPGLAERLRALTVPVVAVSPIVGGKALKGPAAKIMAELGVEVSAVAVARHLAGRLRLDGFVLDAEDAGLAPAVADLNIVPLVTDTIMTSAESRERLAQDVLAFAEDLAVQRGYHAGTAPRLVGHPTV